MENKECINCNGVVGPPVKEGWCQYCIDIWCDDEEEIKGYDKRI